MSPHQKILKKRERAVGDDDLTGVSGLFVRFYKTENEKKPPRGISLTACWNRYVPYTPEQVYDRFREGHHGSVLVDVSINHQGKFAAEILPQGSGWGGHCNFHLPEKTTGDSKIQVSPEKQGKGIGTTWMKNNLEFARAMGFDEFRFEASLGNGAYSWAKNFGALIDESPPCGPGFKEVTQKLTQSFGGRLEAIKPGLSQVAYQHAQGFCTINHKDGVLNLAKNLHDIPVRDVSEQTIENALRKFYREHRPLGRAPQYRVEDEKSAIIRAFKEAQNQELTPNLARILLVGNMWPGVIKLKNSETTDEKTRVKILRTLN